MIKRIINKFANIIENKLPMLNCTYNNITRISVIGNGIMSNNIVLKNIMKVLDENKIDVLGMELTESKISIMFKEIIGDNILEELHKNLI